VLFQRRIGAETRAIPAATIRKILTSALTRTGLTGPAGAQLHYTPHDFRRMFLTDAEVSGVASAASFGGSREHALPAAQRAARRPAWRAGAAGGAVTCDVSSWLHQTPGCAI
jgi:integrase